mmetsp:Transcript_47920/g.111800  ORF Transcript_47920/g.111800 Transcript_47920/m.111800 type:complete len:86 (-) Transcript_47920:807-1064(-)
MMQTFALPGLSQFAACAFMPTAANCPALHIGPRRLLLASSPQRLEVLLCLDDPLRQCLPFKNGWALDAEHVAQLHAHKTKLSPVH